MPVRLGPFYIAHPIRSIETRLLPTLTHVLPPISTSRFAPSTSLASRGSVQSLLPSSLYVDHSHGPVLAPATLAALPSTRAIPIARVLSRNFCFLDSSSETMSCAHSLFAGARTASTAALQLMHHKRLMIDGIKRRSQRQRIETRSLPTVTHCFPCTLR
jgi:hypothetical protein